MIRRYRRRVVDVTAIQNDGTDNKASIIAAWVRAHGGDATAMLTGTVEEHPDKAYVFVENERSQKIAAPSYWVVRLPSGNFHVISDRDFRYLYYEIDEVPEEPPS